MSIGNKPTKEFLSITDERNIFFHYYNFIEINPYTCNYDNSLKNYTLNYNLYLFYNYFFSFVLEKTKHDIYNMRTSLLKQRLLKRLNTRILFFHKRMLQSNQHFLYSKNNSILSCV